MIYFDNKLNEFHRQLVCGSSLCRCGSSLCCCGSLFCRSGSSLCCCGSFLGFGWRASIPRIFIYLRTLCFPTAKPSSISCL